MSQGWISLHRKIMQNPIFTERRTFSKFEAWIWLLLRANHSKGKVLIGNHMIEVERGSLITSQHKLCKIFNWGTTKLRAFLNLLQSETMIEWKALPKATCVTISNYDTYQNLQNDNKIETKQKQNTNKIQTKTNNNVKEKETIEIREQKFINLVLAEGLKITPMVDPKIIDEFCNYWCESNMAGKKLKFEMQQTFDIGRRLKKWISNKEEWNIESKGKYQYEDFKFDSTGYNKIGYCIECHNSDFYKKPQYEDSRCCSKGLSPNKEVK